MPSHVRGEASSHRMCLPLPPRTPPCTHHHHRDACCWEMPPPPQLFKAQAAAQEINKNYVREPSALLGTAMRFVGGKIAHTDTQKHAGKPVVPGWRRSSPDRSVQRDRWFLAFGLSANRLARTACTGCVHGYCSIHLVCVCSPRPSLKPSSIQTCPGQGR